MDRFGPSHPWLGLIAGPLAALASFLAAYFVDPLNFADRAPLAALPAFLLAVAVLLVTHNVAAYRELERAANDSRRIHDALQSYLHVTEVGAPEQALRYIASRLPAVREVRNTSFNILGQTDRADDMFYNTELYDELTESVALLTATGLRWKDVGDSLAADRFEALSANARHHGGGTRYRYRLLGHCDPQLNFILLSYGDQDHEVLFNWDFRSYGRDPIVLLSRDAEIVHMFTVQFEQLWASAKREEDG